MLSIPKSLRPILQAADRRRRLQVGIRLLLYTLSLGLLLSLLLTLLGRVYPLTWSTRLLAWGLGLTAVGIILTQLYAWLSPRSSLATAHQLDRQLGLDERLFTALELTQQSGRTPPHLIEAQLADTVARLKHFNAAQALPWQWPWRWLGLACVLGAALALNLLIPNPQLDVLTQQAKTEETIAEQKAKFEEVRAELLEDKPLLDTPQGQETLQTLDELIKNLEENNSNLEAAMAAISTAEQKLAQLQDINKVQQETLNDLAQTFSQFETTSDLAQALAQRKMAEAAQALSSIGDQLASNPEKAQNLAEALQQAAQAAQAAGNTELADALQQAAAAVGQAADQEGQNGTGQAAQEALQKAANALAEAGQQQAGQEAVEQALANIQQVREQLAQASGLGEGAEQSQQLGQGQGTGAGARAEPGQGTGGGSGREDPDGGAEGLTAEQGTSNEMSTDNGPNEGRTSEYESLYAPLHLGGEGGPVVKPEEQGATGGLPIGEAAVDPNQAPGQALVPYNQIYGQYSNAASQALDESYIPLGMKGYVRQYFGALEPQQ